MYSDRRVIPLLQEMGVAEMRTKEIAKTAKMYSDRRVIYLLQEICVAETNGEVRFLTGSF